MTNPLTPEAIDAELKAASDYELAQLARNELALRRRLANEDAQQQEAVREVERKREEAAQAAVDTFKQQARAAFPGSAAEFDAAWPEIKKQWQIQRSLNAMSAAQRKAASGIY